MLEAFAAWIEVMIGTIIFIIKVIYKMIPHAILQFSFDGDHWKTDVSSSKGIPQMEKTRLPVWVTGVKIVFKFMSRGCGASLREWNVVGDIEVSCERLNCKQNILNFWRYTLLVEVL